MLHFSHCEKENLVILMMRVRQWIEVMFDLLEKEIVLNDNGYEAYIITCALLKAINKQAEELGWI